MTRVDVDSGHGGAIFDDGDAPVAVVVKMRNQWVTKHYIIAAKPKQDSARAETHCSALATATRARRRGCRPWRRNTTSGDSQRN